MHGFFLLSFVTLGIILPTFFWKTILHVDVSLDSNDVVFSMVAIGCQAPSACNTIVLITTLELNLLYLQLIVANEIYWLQSYF